VIYSVVILNIIVVEIFIPRSRVSIDLFVTLIGVFMTLTGKRRLRRALSSLSLRHFVFGGPYKVLVICCEVLKQFLILENGVVNSCIHV
jgi:hypothetical protein